MIERRCSRLVAEQACDGNHRSSRLYGQRRRGVTEVVRSDRQAQRSVAASKLSRRKLRFRSGVKFAEGKQVLKGWTAPGDWSVRQRQFPDRNGACLVIFHRRHFASRRLFRVRARYSQPTQIEIDIGPSQRRQLAPTKSAVPRNDDWDPVSPGIDLICELPQFSVRERLGLISLDLR